MSRKPALIEYVRTYDLPVIDPAKMARINKAIQENQRWQVIVRCALENKTSADIAAEKIIFSNSDRNKGQPVTGTTIRSEMRLLSKKVGFKVTINGLNLYSQKRRIYDGYRSKKKREREEVDVSDCCHSEDVKSIQPPLRSAVQSSPDDPYYVCGSCGQKCELETITRKELET